MRQGSVAMSLACWEHLLWILHQTSTLTSSPSALILRSSLTTLTLRSMSCSSMRNRLRTILHL
jgi:hypothetical protein